MIKTYLLYNHCPIIQDYFYTNADLIKLKEDCLNWLSNPEKYPEYVDIDDIECEFRDIADVLCIIWKLFNLSLKKFKIEIYLDW